MLDIAAVAEVADEAGVPLLIDNTFATPYLCRPIEHGADLVPLGHEVDLRARHVDRRGAGRRRHLPLGGREFPGLVEPSPGYRGLRYAETFGNFAFIMKARVETMRDLGPVLSPFNAFLLLQGLETLSLRMDRHVANALAVAEFLEGHAGVDWVSYPGLPDQPRARAGGALPAARRRRGGHLRRARRPRGRAAVDRGLRALLHLANVGDAKTLIIHPASTTHRRLDEEGLALAGVTDDMVRVSVGLETLDDIIWDLDRAIRASA